MASSHPGGRKLESAPRKRKQNTRRTVAMRCVRFGPRVRLLRGLLRNSHAINRIGGGKKVVNAPQHVLEECWMLAAQDAMLDVAAAMAAAEQETSLASIQSVANRPELAIQWAVLEERETETRT